MFCFVPFIPKLQSSIVSRSSGPLAMVTYKEENNVQDTTLRPVEGLPLETSVFSLLLGRLTYFTNFNLIINKLLILPTEATQQLL